MSVLHRKKRKFLKPLKIVISALLATTMIAPSFASTESLNENGKSAIIAHDLLIQPPLNSSCQASLVSHYSHSSHSSHSSHFSSSW